MTDVTHAEAVALDKQFRARVSAVVGDIAAASAAAGAMRRRHPVEYAAVEADLRAQRPVQTVMVAAGTKPVVYFVQAGKSGPIKIGFATDLTKRIASLQTGCPDDLRLLAVVDGGREVERRMHNRVAGDRIRGEWFRPTAEVLALVAEVSG